MDQQPDSGGATQPCLIPGLGLLESVASHAQSRGGNNKNMESSLERTFSEDIRHPLGYVGAEDVPSCDELSPIQASPPAQGSILGIAAEHTSAPDHHEERSSAASKMHSNIPSDVHNEPIHPPIATDHLQGAAPEGDAEWESDSSALSDSTSSISSSEASAEDGEDETVCYSMSVEEMARMLMREEYDADLGTGKTKPLPAHGGDHPKEQIIELPQVDVTPEMEIRVLGSVEDIVDNTVLVSAQQPGNLQVLESGSILCLENRLVVGQIYEALGRVQQPKYTILYNNKEQVEHLGIHKGRTIFFVVNYSTFVFTQTLKSAKGSDASNLHDDEIGEDEMEFSDDEAEAAHKRAQKQRKRLGTRTNDGVPGRNLNSAASRRSNKKVQTSQPLPYEDDSASASDGYTRLSRPDDFMLMHNRGVQSPAQQYPQAFSGRPSDAQNPNGIESLHSSPHTQFQRQIRQPLARAHRARNQPHQSNGAAVPDNQPFSNQPLNPALLTNMHNNGNYQWASNPWPAPRMEQTPSNAWTSQPYQTPPPSTHYPTHAHVPSGAYVNPAFSMSEWLKHQNPQ